MASVTNKEEGCLNRHINDQMRTPYKDLCLDLILKSNSKIKNPKQHLSLVREMCIYIGPQILISEPLMLSFLTLIDSLPDLDVERKIIRTCYYLFVELLNVDGDQKLYPQFSSEINRLLLNEISTQQGARLCLGWRIMAKMAQISQTEDYFISTLTNKIKLLHYPEKPRKQLLGQKKLEREYRNQIENWTALFSSYRRTDRLLSVECLENALIAASSTHIALSRHALALISKLIQKKSAEAGPAFMSKLRQKLLQHSDTLSVVHLLYACQCLGTSGNTSSQDLAEVRQTMISMLGDKSLKISLEAAKGLGEYWGFREVMEGKNKEQSEGPSSSIGLVASCLVGHLQDITISDFNLIPICRGCMRLGKVLVLRPRQSGHHVASSGLPGEDEEDVLSITLRPLGKRLSDLVEELAGSTLPVPFQSGELFKALIWIIPDSKDSSDSFASVWKWLTKKIIGAQFQLGPTILESLIQQVQGRLCDTPFYSPPAVEMVLRIAESGLMSMPTENLAATLLSVWTGLLPSPHAPVDSMTIHAKKLLLRSLSSVLEYNVEAATSTTAVAAASHSFVTSPPPTSTTSTTTSLSLTGPAVLKSIRTQALWLLANKASIWIVEVEHQTPADGIGYWENVLFDTKMRSAIQSQSTSTVDDNHEEEGLVSVAGVPLLVNVVMLLIQGLRTESRMIRNVCAKGLYQLAVSKKTRKMIGLPLLVMGELSTAPTSISDLSLMLLHIQAILENNNEMESSFDKFLIA